MRTSDSDWKRRVDNLRATTSGQRGRVKEAREAVDLAHKIGDQNAVLIAQGRLDAAESALEQTETLEVALLRQMSGTSGQYVSAWTDDPTAVAGLERLSMTNDTSVKVGLGPLQTPEQLCEDFSTGMWHPATRRQVDGFGRDMLAASTLPDTTVGRRTPFFEGPGVIPQPRRRLRLLDLISSSPVNGNLIPYIVESGSFDTAAETEEGSVKPTGDIGVADKESPVRTIAHFIKGNRQELSDVPLLDTLLRTRLAYGVYRRLETAILSGDGTGQNLTGILTTSGIGNVAYASSTPLGDLALAGIVAELNSESEPNGIVMNATTLQSLLTPKASGSGEYLNSEGPFSMVPTQLWGINLVISTALSDGVVLVGDFANGCHLWVREAVNVMVGLDSDDFTRNRVTLLGEGRFGVTVNVPSYFTTVHLS